MTEIPHTQAQWRASLDADCPHCKEYVDLLEADAFWDGRGDLQIAEHGTPRTEKMAVTCPECGGDFTVECVW